MKTLFTGLESSGKSLALAREIIRLLKRNKRWYKKNGFKREIWTNLKLDDEFYNNNKDYIKYWFDMKEIIGKIGIDVIWDEISTDFSAIKKDPLPKSVNRWLRQGAKQGVHIYATAQEFHDVHLDFRRRVKECFNMVKLIGSSRGGENLPKVKRIWGVCFLWSINIHPYNELAPEKVSKIPELLFITKQLCSVFNTHQPIQASEYPPLEHILRTCPVCHIKQVRHV